MSNVGLIVAENLASLSFMFHLSSLFKVFSMIGENKLIKIMYLKIPITFLSKKSLLGQMGKFGSTIVQHQANLYLVIKITLVKFPKKSCFGLNGKLCANCCPKLYKLISQDLLQLFPPTTKLLE